MNTRDQTQRRSSRPSPKSESVPQHRVPDADPSPSGFAQLGLGAPSLKAVERAGFDSPTAIQAKFIPAALSGHDSVGLARTGTGKTAAFLLPFFEQVYQGRSERMLILAPTRELTEQTTQASQSLSGSDRPTAVAIYGGKPIKAQINKLQHQPDIVVATPGRLLDHAGRGTIDLSAFSVVVMDEVDRMFDMGFRPDITRIVNQCTNRSQTMFLSATMPSAIMSFANQYLSDPMQISAIDDDSPSVATIEQRYFPVAPGRKRQLLAEVLKREAPELCLIFTRTKRGAEKLGNDLRKKGHRSGHIHGGLSQGQRQRAMDRFRSGKTKLLVTTDVLGRGIDVDGISHVINYDIPENPKDYLHRIGRSGRMNNTGKAITFVTPDQGEEITEIELLCHRRLQADSIDAFDNGIPGA